jgi:hypothetical protein
MKLYTTDQIKLSTDENNNPYFIKRVKFENEDKEDLITDVECVIEIALDKTDELTPSIYGLKCFDMIHGDEKNDVKASERELFQIKTQIFKIILNKI